MDNAIKDMKAFSEAEHLSDLALEILANPKAFKTLIKNEGFLLNQYGRYLKNKTIK